MATSRIMRLIQSRKAASLLAVPSVPPQKHEGTGNIANCLDFPSDGTGNTSKINSLQDVPLVPSQKSIGTMGVKSVHAHAPSALSEWKNTNEINDVPSVPSQKTERERKNTNEINVVPSVPLVPSQKTMIWEKTDTRAHADWREVDKAYQAHHWMCLQCIASGKGHGQMCDEGQKLWDVYEAAPMPEFGRAKR